VFVTDVAAVAWIVVWLALAWFVVGGVRELHRLSDGVGDTAAAIRSSGEVIGSLGDVPVLGDKADDAAKQIGEAGDSVEHQAGDGRAAIDRVSLIVGGAVAALGILPLLWSYGPPRLARHREVRGLRELLAAGGGAAGVDEFLARRAAYSLSYRSLRRITDDPARDLEEGRFGPLAAAELRRLGIAPNEMTSPG
jgi:hypothetical protein